MIQTTGRRWPGVKLFDLSQFAEGFEDPSGDTIIMPVEGLTKGERGIGALVENYEDEFSTGLCCDNPGFSIMRVHELNRQSLELYCDNCRRVMRPTSLTAETLFGNTEKLHELHPSAEWDRSRYSVR